ncbi:MAG: hypothetical protein U0271_07360 [Polyangiaceae bacterium]
MDLVERLNLLESVRDWQTLVEELERAIASERDAAVKASHYLLLGRVLEERFLQSVKALKFFQEAYKLSPSTLEALERARGVYWELGKAPMVQKLLDIELRSFTEGPDAVERLVELGDVLLDAGDLERATATYAKALGVSNGSSDDARSALADSQLDNESWSNAVAELVAISAEQEPREACRTLLRAGRVAHRFGSADADELFQRAYEANPLDRQAANLFEGRVVAAGQAESLEEIQRAYLAQLPPRAKGLASFKFGARWLARHQNQAIGARWRKLSWPTPT